jgi:tetratricopeptide (TPR) repeat protein
MGLMAALASHVGLAAELDGAGKALAEQGQYWQARGNAARATEAWERLLKQDPNQVDAIYNLGLLEAGAKRNANAQGYLKRLQALGTAPLQTARLEQEISLQSGTKPQDLQKARVLAESGELDKAIETYRRLFDGKPPQGAVAREYYRFLGYTDTGLPEARQGLARLLRESPDDTATALWLAKHLIRDESTRADGIARLIELSKRSDIGGDAAQSWRMALTWYAAPKPADAPLFQAYLKANPDDEEIREQLRKAQAAPRAVAAAPVAPQDMSVANGFKELEGGDMAAAEQLFQTRLKSKPQDADALGGLGLLRLRQNRPDDAVALLTRASTLGGSRSNWKQALGNAKYWSLTANAEKLRANGDLSAAEQLLEQAVRMKTDDGVAETALAGVLAETGKLQQAEEAYRGLLARNRSNSTALEGLVSVLGQLGKADEALALIDRMTPEQQQHVGSIGTLRAKQSRAAAKAAAARGDDVTAQRELETALRHDPQDPWLRLDLARLYLKSGATTDARSVVDGLLLTHPDLPAALFTSALLAAELQDWSASLAALERIAPQNRTREILALQKRSWLNYQLSKAGDLAKSGRRAEALSALAQLEPEIGDDVPMLGGLATAYADAGNGPRALILLRQALGRTPKQDNALYLQYASLLIKTDQDAEAAGILRQLQGQLLNDADRRGFEELRRLFSVRQSDALRTRGKLADGYDVLSPLLVQYPNDPLIMGALARLYDSAGDGTKALAIYKQLLQRDPENIDLLLAAAQSAAQAKDNDAAESALNTALGLQPQNAKVLAAAARVYRAQGKSGKAAEFFKQAIAAQKGGQPEAIATQTAAAYAEPTQTNPFAALPGQTRSNPATIQSAQTVAQAAPIVLPAQPAVVPYASSPVFHDAVSAPNAYGAASPGMPSDASRAQEPLRSQPRSTGAGTQITTDYVPVRNPAPAPSLDGRPVPASITGAALPRESRPLAYAAAAGSTYDVPVRNDIAPNPAPQALANRTLPAARQTLDGTISSRLMEQELADIQQARSPLVTVGTTMRQHSGQAGLSKLVDVESPVTVQFPVGEGEARGFVQATPVTLRSGQPANTDQAAGRFGGGPAAMQAGNSAGNQRASGVGVAVGYESNGIKVDVGSTPVGFRQQNVVGGVRLNDVVENEDSRFSYGIDASRRAVTDSVVSFAGARDARTGQEWGGVTSTGARVSAGLDYGDYGFYGNAGWHSLEGHNVASNSRVSGTAGTYVHLIRRPDRQLTTGFNVSGMSYDKNLGYYTYGHGGYFSPQTFMSASVPLSWSARQGKLSYSVKGSVGVQRIKQDSAPYFPNASLQAQAEAAAAANGESALYPGQSKTGLGYGLGMATEYQVSPQVFLGAHLGVDNARDYRQFAGGLYLRYALEPQTGPVPFPVQPVNSPYALD